MASADISNVSYVCQPSNCDFRCCVEDRCGRSLFECQDATVVFWVSIGVLILFLGVLALCWRLFLSSQNPQVAGSKVGPLEAPQSANEQTTNSSGIKGHGNELKLNTMIDKMNDQSVRKATIADPAHVEGTSSAFVVSNSPDQGQAQGGDPLSSPAVDSKDDMNVVQEIQRATQQVIAQRLEDSKQGNVVVIHVASGEEGRGEESSPDAETDLRKIVIGPKEPLHGMQLAFDEFHFSPHRYHDDPSRNDAYRREKSLSGIDDLTFLYWQLLLTMCRL